MAQVVLRGNPPKIVTSGVTVEYSIMGNTTSYGKRAYGGFWDNITALFGLASLQHDVGLTGNKLSGTMTAATGHFEATGIPVTPVNDLNVWDPLQVAEVTVKDGSGKTLATTRATVPTSDDINCAKCHGADAFNDVLMKHDDEVGTTLAQSKPVLCAKCHGTMAQVASSQQTGRIPWANEPTCATCHSGVTDAGSTAALYRASAGHGNMMCSACHGSPHAMVPSLKEVDNYQAMQYQPYSSSPKTLGSCGTCHDSSRGEGNIGEYAEAHGGSNPEKQNGCFICHTSVEANISKWPHAFTWQNSN